MNTSRYAELFETESREHLAALNHWLLELERQPEAREPVSAMFRAVHTVKGMGAAMGYVELAQLAHELETVLDRVRRQEQPVTRALIDTCLEAADALDALTVCSVQGRAGEADVAGVLARLESCGGLDERAGATTAGSAGERGDSGLGAPAASRGNEAPFRPPAARHHARVELRRLDTLMDLIGELVIARDRLVRLEPAAEDRALSEAISQVSRLTADLQKEIMRCRMVPVWQVFERFPRLVRDAARALEKEIAFSVEGKEIELDRALLEEIAEPVVHLLRNAVDHGIEPPAARAAGGKPTVGRLCVTAARERSRVTIRVIDDGRGIERERVLAQARALELVDAATRELTDDELIRLISRPGFSTAGRVTDLSGRGVGLDAVQSRVRTLGGSMRIESAEGKGTTVTLCLPVSLAVIRALIVRVANERYVVPMTHIDQAAELQPSAVRKVDGRDVLLMPNRILPLLRLRDLVRLPTSSDAGSKVLVLELGGRRAALVVDDIVGQQDVVVKQFDLVRDGGGRWGGVPLFTGATILGDGAPALIVDVGSLL